MPRTTIKRLKLSLDILFITYEIYGIVFFTQYYLFYQSIHIKYVHQYPILLPIAMIAIIIAITRFMFGKKGPLGYIVVSITLLCLIIVLAFFSIDTFIRKNIYSHFKSKLM